MASNEGPGGERTEQATPKRKREARERGQVLKSMELTTALMMLILFGSLLLVGGGLWEQTGLFTKDILSGSRYPGFTLTMETAQSIFQDGLLRLALIILPILVIAFLAGALTNVVQVGFMFSTKALQPKFSRINPIEGFKRMFSSRTLYELAKTIVKTILIAWVAYGNYRENMERFGLMAGESVSVSIEEIGRMIIDVGITIGFVLLLMSALDFFYQWWQHEKQLRMTKYEVKLEYKQMEGDPQVRGRIKQKQRQMATMRMMQAVPGADVVITNPTHYAIALKYDEEQAPAPVVVAKGADLLAQRIKECAVANGVEIVENKPVAQSLYAMCEVGDQIPEELFQAVAEVLAYVFKLKNKH
ncbi:MAG: flagellar biosynthesis protein FlhB [Eubacteriales bacterium]|nr:flagellar biosynthesis protein FlhB [Eubacteriales bacterium]